RAGDLAVEAPGLLLDPWGNLEDALAGGQGELVLAAAGGRGQRGVVGLPAGRRGGVGVQLGPGVGAVGLVGRRRRGGGVGDAAEVDLEGHAGLYVAGDGALAGERLGDGAR